MTHRKLIASTLAVVISGFAAQLNAQLGSYNPEPGPRETVAIVNARIIPVSGAEIPSGTVVIADGRIQAIGTDVTVPAGARRIDASGLSVYPGMMDAGTSMGLAEITQGAAGTVDNSETGSWNPNVQALWGIDPHSAHIGVTRVVGITHVVSRPTGGVLSGQAALINLAGYTAPAMAIEPKVAAAIQLPGTGGGGRGRFGGGGNNSQDQGGVTPLDSLKAMIADAKAYGAAMAASEADNTIPRPDVDLKLAALLPILSGDMPVIFPAQSEAQIKSVVEFSEENGINAVILGGRDAWRMTDYLVEHDVAVLLSSTLSLPNRDDDPYDANYAAAGKLADAGVRFAIVSGESNPDVRNLPYVAGMSAAFGLSREDAIRAVTLWPAQLLGVDSRLGSLEVGKIANLVVTDGDLLEATTTTHHLFIDGRNVPLATKHSELYDTFKDRR